VWGEGKSGQLGVEGLSETSQPILVTSLTEQDIHVKAACAGGHHSLILTCKHSTMLWRRLTFSLADGKIYATGWNKFGQLGLAAEHDARVFERVTLPEKITKISCGGDHSLALTSTHFTHVQDVFRLM
jgi:alpha-tubulin suppressor-like RCC1 family protein